MLKRCQVLLEDWQLEHLRLVAEKCDFSMSEMLRIVLCEGLLHTCPYLYPECKTKIMEENEIGKIAIEGCNPATTQERKHQLASKLYFEARKAIEHMNSELNKERSVRQNNTRARSSYGPNAIKKRKI